MAINRTESGLLDSTGAEDLRHIELGRQAARLSAQIVSRCDLLLLELEGIEAQPLRQELRHLSLRSMDAARICTSLSDGTESTARFVELTSAILCDLERVQQFNQSCGQWLRIEDLLSLQVTALDLAALASNRSGKHASDSLPDGAAVERAHILIVDDDESNREILSRILRNCPWQVSTAASGAEALKEAQAQHLDLMMLDVLMPGMDGLSVAAR